MRTADSVADAAEVRDDYARMVDDLTLPRDPEGRYDRADAEASLRREIAQDEASTW